MPETPHAPVATTPKLLYGLPVPPADYKQLPEGISLCMIVKNEERFLAACLRSVQGIVDEINIVDTGSTDRTVEIAREFGARVEFHAWRDDFSWARNKALDMATRRWTLVLDADEEIAPESRRAVLDLRTVQAYHTVLFCRITNDIDDFEAAATMSHSLPRIFPTTPLLRYAGVIHEGLVFDQARSESTGVVAPVRILHKGYTMEIFGARNKEARNAPLLRRATEVNGEDSYAWFNLGNSLVGGEDWEEGIAALERMRSMDTDKRFRAYIPLGYCTLATTYASRKQDYDKALEVIDECIERVPHYVLGKFAKAEILYRAKRYDEAREWFRKAIESKNVEDRHLLVDDEIVVWKAHYNVAATYIEEERWSDAIPWLEEAKRNKPEIWAIYERLGTVYENSKRFFDAEVVLREAFERFSTERATVSYIDYLLRRQRMTRALEVIEGALPTATPTTAAALNLAAALIVSLTESDDPVPYLLRALAISPGSGIALTMLDKIYGERGCDAERAALRRAEFDAPLVGAPDYARRSSRWLEEARPEDAARVATDGLALSPKNAPLLFNYALGTALCGDPERAIDALARLISGETEIVETGAYLRATLLEQLGRRAEALAVLEATFGDEPVQEDACLMRARLLAALGHGERAEAALRHAMGTGRKRIGVELASMMLREGRYDDARNVAETALTPA